MKHNLRIIQLLRERTPSFSIEQLDSLDWLRDHLITAMSIDALYKVHILPMYGQIERSQYQKIILEVLLSFFKYHIQNHWDPISRDADREMAVILYFFYFKRFMAAFNFFKKIAPKKSLTKKKIVRISKPLKRWFRNNNIDLTIQIAMKSPLPNFEKLNHIGFKNLVFTMLLDLVKYTTLTDSNRRMMRLYILFLKCTFKIHLKLVKV